MQTKNEFDQISVKRVFLSAAVKIIYTIFSLTLNPTSQYMFFDTKKKNNKIDKWSNRNYTNVLNRYYSQQALFLFSLCLNNFILFKSNRILFLRRDQNYYFPILQPVKCSSFEWADDQIHPQSWLLFCRTIIVTK